jgi:dephospho-CoA kinase
MDGEVPRDAAASPIRIVLGGGIGAGKTAVGELLADHGFTVVVADRIGHRVLVDDPMVRRAIGSRWPDVVVDGVVDRGRLARHVFGDRSALDELEAITHPPILDAIRDTVEAAAGDVCIEMPVLPLARIASEELGRPVLRMAVVADVPTRVARAVARGGDPDDVTARMAVQAPDDEWRSWADVVIDNGGAWSATEAAVMAVIEDLRTHV